MKGTKVIKTRCTKTGKQFALEVLNVGGRWEIVNMVDLTAIDADHIYTEIGVTDLVTSKSLVACNTCGGRKFAGCSCAERSKRCSASDKYDFQCVYCRNMQIDYSRCAISSGPYTKWAGITNIPAEAMDRFGNPQGSQYDLAQDGSFKGYTVIVLYVCTWGDFSLPEAALRKKGFDVKVYRTLPSVPELQRLLSLPNSQLWYISHNRQFLTPQHAQLIYDFYNAGHGTYVWGDNNPFFADANVLLKGLFGTQMSGDYIGDKVLSVRTSDGQPGIIANHPITTGIINFYEGITIANIAVNNTKLKPLMYSSDGKVVAAFYDSEGKRAIADGGFTRLYHKWDSAGTDRYVVNAAAWLANIERFGYNRY